MDKVMAYVRVSDDDQVETGYSLADQEAKCHDYQAKHAVLNQLAPVDVKIEPGVSAKKKRFLQRKVGRALDDQLQRGDHLLLPKVDRAFRRLSDFVYMMDYWKERGVIVHILDLKGLQIDTSTPIGRFLMNMLAVIAELEADFVSQRTRDAMARARLQGKYMGGWAGYGKRHTGKNRHKKVVEDPNELRQMALLWEMFQKRLPVEDVYRHFRDTGERTGRGKEWSRNRLRRAYKAEVKRRHEERSQPSSLPLAD